MKDIKLITDNSKITFSDLITGSIDSSWHKTDEEIEALKKIMEAHDKIFPSRPDLIPLTIKQDFSEFKK